MSNNPTMYTLRYNGRKVKNASGSYEEMRQLARKRIRATLANRSARLAAGYDAVSRNPVSIREFGFEIARAA